MGLFRELSRENLRHRLLGGGHRRHRGPIWGPPRHYWHTPRHYGHWMGRRHHRGPFAAYRPRRRTEVRGCGCCLPIPLALVAGSAAGLRALLRSP